MPPRGAATMVAMAADVGCVGRAVCTADNGGRDGGATATVDRTGLPTFLYKTSWRRHDTARKRHTKRRRSYYRADRHTAPRAHIPHLRELCNASR